ncbi:MAG: oligogalacturonate lyase family protein, partial [Vibrio fluvialis]
MRRLFRAKGDVIQLAFESFIDSDTQVKVTRLT